MPIPTLKTDAEHLVFLKSLAALKVRFALDWTADHPGTGFAQALSDRTFFVNLGVWHQGELFDNPQVEGAAKVAWDRFLADAGKLAGEPDAEAAIMGLLPPDLDYFAPRVSGDQAELHDKVQGLAALEGCLWVNEHPRVMTFPPETRAPKTLEFHMANNKYPGSFLKNTDEVRDAVRKMAHRAKDLGFTAIGTRSWLNDHPVWLSCFPQVWTDRLSPADPGDVGGHLGNWGQAITGRQTLSSHADQYIRANRRLELAMRASWITVEEALN